MRTRLLLGGAGVALGVWGVVRLLQHTTTTTQLVSVAQWWVGVVIGHDFVLVPLTLLVVFLGGKVLPTPYRLPGVVGLVVYLPLLLVAVPALTGAQRHRDNASALDQPYAATLLVLAVVVALGVLGWGLLRSRHRSQPNG